MACPKSGDKFGLFSDPYPNVSSVTSHTRLTSLSTLSSGIRIRNLIDIRYGKLKEQEELKEQGMQLTVHAYPITDSLKLRIAISCRQLKLVVD